MGTSFSWVEWHDPSDMALEKFRSYEKTETYKEGLMKLASSSKQSVAVQLNDQLNKDMENARSALLDIFTTLRFLYRQGLSIRGHEDAKLRKEDVPGLEEWMGRSRYKWLSHDIQNEIIDILGKSVLRSVVCGMKKREHVAIMVDETCDISIHEQVTFCVPSVDENLTTSEDFVGLYETPNTEGKKTLFAIVKNILASLDLNIENLRGQCYESASAVSGKFKGLQKFDADLQPKAICVHCAVHSLNLAVQDCLRHLPYMRDIKNLTKDFINTVRESPKKVQLFKNISEDEEIGLCPLCPTRWTMRTSSIQQVLINYERLAEIFEIYSEEYSSDAASKCAGYLETMQHFRPFSFRTSIAMS
ncbi:hypothetical protein PR048_025626 [Dryococelus australis]|uniref:DUF4371 domain-containing protein n=1 Tax=Dryococelus australis TaxID=614101 RepID=A0ABQ9GRV6_9NEOP|nr:hypothetical protein PR048_025626 [Dryococelus australis]